MAELSVTLGFKNYYTLFKHSLWPTLLMELLVLISGWKHGILVPLSQMFIVLINTMEVLLFHLTEIAPLLLLSLIDSL